MLLSMSSLMPRLLCRMYTAANTHSISSQSAKSVTPYMICFRLSMPVLYHIKALAKLSGSGIPVNWV